jgi:hypothetical protein
VSAVTGGCALLVVGALSLAAQPTEGSRRSAWGDSAATALAGRAIARRVGELGDTTLRDWRATARGHLAFLGQLGDGWIETPRLVQTEELALELAWQRPNRSVQRLVGRRDSLLLPGNVGYYRSRYAVVLNDLPDLIRLGDGQDVRDVPHPLSPGGLALYEVALGDTLRIRLPGGAIDVQELLVRPRDATQPRVVGTVYLDASNAAVVRLAFTFTRSAILDKRIETLAVTLENGLVSGRYWLPRRQEVEVARRDAWLDIPARGVVRGRWEVSGYTVNDSAPVAQLLRTLPPFSVARADSLRAFPFEGSVLDRLPADIQLTTDEEVREVRVKAEAAVRDAMLVRRAGTSLSGRGVSDAFRITRTEGVALGVGVSRVFGSVVRPSARVRYGFSDRALKGRVAISRVTSPGSATPIVELFAERDYRDLARAERSGAANSLGALFGSDLTSQVDARAVGVSIVQPLAPGRSARVELAVERQDPLVARFGAPVGEFVRTPVAEPLDGVRLRIEWGGGGRGDGPDAWRRTWRMGIAGGGFRFNYDRRNPQNPPIIGGPPVDVIEFGSYALGRVDGQLTLERSWRGGTRGALVSLTAQAQQHTGVALAPQQTLVAGGPLSGPGYDLHTFAGKAIGTVRAEWRVAAPFVPLPLWKYGKAPGRVTLVPFVHAVGLAAPARFSPITGDARVAGVYPSVGLGGLFVFDLLRVDVARGLRDGRWMLNIDVDRAFWGIL